MSGVTYHGERMKRTMPGLYDSVDVRAERIGLRGSWKFEMRVHELRTDWLEYSPHGSWRSIGTWPTLGRGLYVASLLRQGSHYYDLRDHKACPFTTETYDVLRKDHPHAE